MIMVEQNEYFKNYLYRFVIEKTRIRVNKHQF